MKTFTSNVHHVTLLLLVLCMCEHIQTHASLIPEKWIEDVFSSHEHSTSTTDKATMNLILERSLQLDISIEPVPSEEALDILSVLEESPTQEDPEISGENDLPFSSLTTEPVFSPEFDSNLQCSNTGSLIPCEILCARNPIECEAEFHNPDKFFENEVTTEPEADSDLIIVQSKDEPRRSHSISAFIGSSFRFPICVIRRKQMNCFIRKRCGIFVKNGNRVTGSRGPVFNWIRRRGCISKCGFKAGRNCVSG